MCDICWPGNGGKYVATNTTNTFTSMKATGTMTHVEHFWTWREAIEVASRAKPADGRVTVKRYADRWTVSYLIRLTLMNTG
jgi:hypothetical protein